jgi:serine/threonine protein kinase
VKCINKRQFLKRPSLQKYIEQEITTWRDLAHPNIVKLIRSF